MTYCAPWPTPNAMGLEAGFAVVVHIQRQWITSLNARG